MRALIVVGVVQGFSTPPLMLLILFMTNNNSIMGDHVNGRLANIYGSLTTLVSASVALVILWWRRLRGSGEGKAGPARQS
jgi:Mn2+/Fe2+ NRAMP family transporter